MFFPSATAVAALVLNLAGANPFAAGPARREVSARPARHMKVAGGLWAPPKKSKPKSPKDEEAQEEELLKPRKAAADGAGRPKSRRPIKMDESGGEGGDDEADEGDDDDEDGPKVVKRRKRVSEEEDEDAAEPIESQPSVIPRLVNFELGPAVLRRSFAYSQATEQGDKGFRLGYQFALESFPLVSQPSGWYRTFGIGAYYEKEYGDATRDQPSGVFMGAAVNHSRWGFDARYAIPAGESVVIMPAIGYGRIGADNERMTPTMPSMCTSTSPDPCFGDIKAAYLSADLHLRLAISPRMALSLAGGYLQGIGVSRGPDQITAEASASTKGFHVDLGASMLLGDWFALTATVPFRRYVFNFTPASGGAFTARSATDVYYGLVAGIAVLTK
jgi:hypothetical protein